jgi:hypothetical protein
MVDRMHYLEKKNCIYCDEIFLSESILQKVCNKCYLKNRGVKKKKINKKIIEKPRKVAR